MFVIRLHGNFYLPIMNIQPSALASMQETAWGAYTGIPQHAVYCPVKIQFVLHIHIVLSAKSDNLDYYNDCGNQNLP